MTGGARMWPLVRFARPDSFHFAAAFCCIAEALRFTTHTESAETRLDGGVRPVVSRPFMVALRPRSALVDKVQPT